MASASKTPNFNLPQWVGAEKPERTDFNAAFDSIDTNLNSAFASMFTNRGSITDFNAITQTGLYYCFSGALNSPRDGGFTVLHFQPVSSRRVQIAFGIGVLVKPSYRTWEGSSWNSWSDFTTSVI